MPASRWNVTVEEMLDWFEDEEQEWWQAVGSFLTRLMSKGEGEPAEA